MSAKPRAKSVRPVSAQAARIEREVAELAFRMARSPGRWDLRKARRHFEKLWVLHVIERRGGDKRRAARGLGISYASIKEKGRADWTRRYGRAARGGASRSCR